MQVYLVEEGVLLDENDENFEYYNNVYDKEYGYYDEGQYYVSDLDKAIKDAKTYIEHGVGNTYVIISKTFLDDDVDINDAYVEGEDYLVENIVFSMAKINDEIIEDFINV